MMFEPRPPLPYIQPCQRRETGPYQGIAQYLNHFETSCPPTRAPFEAPVERKKRVEEEMQKLNAEKIELMVSDWDPNSNPKATKYVLFHRCDVCVTNDIVFQECV